MNNKEFDRLEKVLSEILTELQIQNKLRALQLTRELLNNAPLSLALNDKCFEHDSDGCMNCEVCVDVCEVNALSIMEVY